MVWSGSHKEVMSERNEALPEVLSSWEDLVDGNECGPLPDSPEVTCPIEKEIELGADEASLQSESPDSTLQVQSTAQEADHSVSLSNPDSAEETKTLQQLTASSFPNNFWESEDSGDFRKQSVKEDRINLVDLDFDTLCRCLELLSLKDVCTVSQCCRRLQEAAYSDLIWQALFKKAWPNLAAPSPQPLPPVTKDSFFLRWKACRQLRFSDPLVNNWSVQQARSPVLCILVNSDQTITVLTSQRLSTWSCNAQGGVERKLFEHERVCRTEAQAVLLPSYRLLVVPIKLSMLRFKGAVVGLSNDQADSEPRPSEGAEGAPGFSAGEVQITDPNGSAGPDQVGGASNLKEHFFLIAEDKVRLYSSLRGCCRTLSGASTEKVLAITNRIFGLPSDAPEAVIAVGGTDKIVRLWTLGMRRRGQGRLLCSLRGHKDAVAFLRVAKHDPSLLISVGSSGIVKLWDVAAALELRGATAGTSRSCLATWKVPGPTAGVAVCGDVCYIAGDTKVTAINLTSLQVLGKVAVHASRITAMALNATGNRLCTGLFNGLVFLWDPSRCDFQNPKPLTELAHPGVIRQILIDSFKIVIRSDESSVEILDAETGSHISSFPLDNNKVCLGRWPSVLGGGLVVAMRGPLLVLGKVRLASADFSNSVHPLEEDGREEKQGHADEMGRFWERPSESEDDEISE